MIKEFIEEVVAYLRLSKDDGKDESTSITNQKRILTEYARTHNMKITEFYIDDGFSAYDFEGRPDFNRLKADLNSGKVSTIIAKDLSRIGRHNAKTQDFLENLQKNGNRLITVTDSYDTLDESANDISGILTWSNEKIVKDTSRKVRDAVKAMQRAGKYISSVPYAYYVDPIIKGKYHLDENAAKYVRMIFEMYISGDGTRKIADTLTDIGAPTYTMLIKQRIEARGLTYDKRVTYSWRANTVKAILGNDFYIGTLRLGKTKLRSINGKQIHLDKDQHIVFENAHESIIDKNTFNIAQEILTDRKDTFYRGNRTKNREIIYGQKLYCSDCGKRLTSTFRNDHVKYFCRVYNTRGTKYCTSHTVHEEEITEAVIMFLQHCRTNLVKSINELDEIIKKEYTRRSNGNTNNLVFLEKSLTEAKMGLKYILEQKMKETMRNPSMADLIEQTYDSMQTEKYKEIAILERQIADIVENTIDDSSIKSSLKTALQVFDNIISSEKITKKQVATIIEKIVIYENTSMDIYLKGNLQELCTNRVVITNGETTRMANSIADYILNNQNIFVGNKMFDYLKEQEFRISRTTVQKYIRELVKSSIIQDMGHRKGYVCLCEDKKELSAVITDILNGKDVIWNQTSTYTRGINAERCSNNSVVANPITFELIMTIHKYIKTIKDKTKYLF